jgi:Rrf2 family protein
MAAELAVRGILQLAEGYGEGPMPLEEICRRRHLPRQYLTKIFGLLARANLITAVRGKGGGYVLARAPGEISLLEVIESVEGPMALNLCTSAPPRCDEVSCRVRPVWADLQSNMRSVLKAKSLEDLVGNGQPSRA